MGVCALKRETFFRVGFFNFGHFFIWVIFQVRGSEEWVCVLSRVSFQLDFSPHTNDPPHLKQTNIQTSELMFHFTRLFLCCQTLKFKYVFMIV